MVDVAAVGCFASLAEATRYRPRAFLRRGFCRVDDALRWASTSTSSSIYCAQSVLGVDPYLGVGSISDSLSCPPTHISIPGYLRHSVISRYRRFHTEIPVARKIVDGPPILPTNFVGAQCCCQLALGVNCDD